MPATATATATAAAPTTSPARIAANRANALKSTGPTTDEGKARSRANAVKHGLTGAGVALPERDRAEVDRRSAAFQAKLNPSGEVGLALVRHAALMSVRMERCAEHELAATADRVRRALDEFEAPEGVADPAEVERLRQEAAVRALFDPSKEACLARKYEASAERGFFRALKELRQVERAAKAEPAPPASEAAGRALGSILREAKKAMPKPPEAPKPAPTPPAKPDRRVEPAGFPPRDATSFVPFAIGRPR